MKLEDDKFKKLYYGIGEVAQKLKVNPSLIRFWEKEFKEIRLKKNERGKRYFTESDIILLQKIHRLVKEEGHTLQGARDALSTQIEKKLDFIQMRKKLEDIRERLIILEKEL